MQGEKMLNDAMCVMLKQLISTLVREGNGWNTAKTHSRFLHVARLVSAFGRPTNCDAEVGERFEGLGDQPRKAHEQRKYSFIPKTSQ